jgi:hypothetical protein
MRGRIVTSVVVFALAACSSEVRKDDAILATEVAQALVDACPVASPGDENARGACAEKLARLTVLRDIMSEPFLWGGQKPGAGYGLADSNTTRFNPLVWRKMYLSLSMFTGERRIERVDGKTVLHLANRFRNELDIGSYPYPFWHSKAKWDSYQYSTELLLIFDSGKLTGALRASDQDPSRPYTPHTFDGQWQWTQNGEAMPWVSLYKSLFSVSNPNITQVDVAYRALEAEARQYACLGCHSPDNTAKQNPLELFSFPNQALESRHNIVARIEANAMPPTGIADDAKRQRLLDLARAFESAADEALRFEGELTTGP